MTDVHCHVTGKDPSVRELVIGRDFVGIHPWEALTDALSEAALGRRMDEMRAALRADPRLGVGEIGLDRLKEREISPRMREVFEAQLALAREFNRPVVLHGAKCWGQVVKAVGRLRQGPQSLASALLFHGFSRSDGLIPEIVALGGYVSVGPSVLNDHAVNYRALVKKIPDDRLLVETDRTEGNAAECPPVAAVAAKLAELRGVPADVLEAQTDANADRAFGPSGRALAVSDAGLL